MVQLFQSWTIITNQTRRQRIFSDNREQRGAEGDQVADSLETNGEPPVGGHRGEVRLLVLVDDELGLPDEFGLKISQEVH